jgi:hypothetical protein
VALNTNELLIVGGSESNGVPEVRANTGSLRSLGNLDLPYFRTRQYPFMQTAPNGKVAYVGPQPQLLQIDTTGSGTVTTGPARDGILRDYGSYALFDAVAGRVLVSGGNYGANSASAVVVNMETNTAAATGSMTISRRQHQLTVLPDGSVLATGGIRDAVRTQDLIDLSRSVFHAEVWHPSTGVWTQLAPQAVTRQYHSAALLLPDGRVLSAGGGKCGPCATFGYENVNYEFFSPPYLYKKDGSGQLAPRPAIASAPATIQVNTRFTIRTPQAAAITKVALIRLGSPTHGVDFEQRYVPLTMLGVTGDELSVNAPANFNIAQSGDYMLFIVDADGVPSIASMVRISQTPGTGAEPTATPAMPSATPTAVATSPAGAGTHVVEAEAMTLNAPMRAYADALAAGGQYVQTIGVASAACTTAVTGGWAETTFTLPAAGAYRVWARALAPTSATDSFCIQLDGAPAVTWAPAIDPAWRWHVVTGLPTTLSAGTHTLRVRYRETGTKLDKLIVTTDLALVPTGLGPGTSTATATPSAPTSTATPTVLAATATPVAPTATPTVLAATATPGAPTATATSVPVGPIYIEAESGVIVAPFVVATDPTAVGAAHIWVPKNAGTASSACALDGAGWVRYSVTIAVAGTYTLWGRTIAPDSGSDSFCLQIDGGPMTIWTPPRSSAWVWGKPQPSSYTISAGAHTISIRYRETGTKLDRLFLTNSGAAPQ